ncbi:MAG: hypothetical protein ACYTBP_12035, partial [Planctomycetota bacterium]
MRKMATIGWVLLAVCAVSAQSAPKVEFVKSENKIDVNIDGKLFTSYIYGDDRPKPSMVHIKTPSGIEVSRRHPLTELEGGTHDH